MKRLRLLVPGLAGLLTLGLSGCLKAPEYSTTPEISFESIYLKHDVSTTQPIDSVFITIRFQDGDGDLGLSDADLKLPQFTYPSRYSSNFFMEPYVKSGSGFASLASLGRTTKEAYYSPFNRSITSSLNGKSGPIKGSLTRVYAIAYRTLYQPGEEARFTVSIADRAMHESNTITTTSIVFPK